MKLHQLKYFIAVAEFENFRKAAEQLHLAQPSLSRQIRLLEAHLGVSLFERVKRRVRLTGAGRELLADARRILSEVNGMELRARELADPEAGRLCIAYSDTAAWAGSVPEALRLFRKLHPQVELDLEATDYPAQIRSLQSGRADAAFLYGPPPEGEEFDSFVVSCEGVLLAMSHANTLLDLPHLTLRSLAEVPFILTARSRNPHYHDAMMRACAEGGLEPRIVYEADNRATMLSLVSADLGVGFMLASARGRHTEVAFRAVEDMHIHLELSLAWHRNHGSSALGHFIESVRSMAARMPLPDKRSLITA